MNKWSPWLVGSLVVACLLVLPTPVHADDFRFQYAAKFLCTANIPGTSGTPTSVVPGTYQTVISIHNPQKEEAQFRKKIVLVSREASTFIKVQLRPDEAVQVDCTAIRSDFGPPPVHGSEGFLVVESTLSLDVNAVHTAAKNGGEVEGIAAQQVPERRIQ